MFRQFIFYAFFTAIYFTVVLMQLDIKVGYEVEQGLREVLESMVRSLARTQHRVAQLTFQRNPHSDSPDS